MGTTAEVLKNIGGWTFDFFSSDDDKTQKTATYSMLLKVSDECVWEPNKILDVPAESGVFQLLQNSDEDIIAAIEQEKELLGGDDDEEGDDQDASNDAETDRDDSASEDNDDKVDEDEDEDKDATNDNEDDQK